MANSTSTFTAPPPSGQADGYSPEIALIFIGVSLGLGALCRQVLQNTRIPYTVAVLLIGIGLGALEYSVGPHLGHLGGSIRMWATINPNLILYVFLPALLFESSFNLEFHQIKRCIFQMLLLAGPGVVISTVLLGCVDKFLLPYGFNWATSLLLGGLLSATDPVAVVALLKSLGASKKLSTIIDGEALMNDGVAIVVFQIFFNITVGRATTASAIISSLFQATFGACALGLLFGVVTLVWIRCIFNDYVQEITIVITSAYMCFYVANDETSMSGVLATLVLGVFLAVLAKAALTGESERSMHHFLEMITYIANTLIFTLSGVVIAATILESGSLIRGADWGYLLLLYLFVQLARFAVVGLLFPGLASSGYGLDWKEGMILGWSGLRGAVALTLALLIYHQPTTDHLSDLTKARIMFLTGGVTFLTLIINGSTTQFLLAFLGLSTVSSTKKRVLEYARHEMYDRALETFEEVGEDEELGPADWPTVRKYVHCLNRPRGHTPHPHRYNSVENLREQQLHDTRIRYLSGVQAAYWTMLEEGRISQTATLLLMQAAAESVDRVNAYHPLELWKGLRPHVKLPTLLKIVQGVRWFPQRWKSSLTVYRVELGAVISAAFLRAQKHARQQLRDWLGESDVAETVLRESREEEVEPRKFLEDVRLSFPQVLRIIKTKQVTSAILSGLTVYVDTLGKAGLLDEKETCALQMAVQTDVKKLQRDPPLVDMPTAAELLATQPLIGALPVSVRSPLEGAAKQHTKLSGSVLAREGEVPDGVWLIASGAVKWTVEDTQHGAGPSPATPGGSEELHPVLAHGSVVGLYAVLANIPHICTATTGSLVQAFFLPRNPILEASRSSYEVLDFLWLEASLPLVKLVFSQQFRGLSIQDLRSFASTSRLLPMRRLATLDLLPQECAILLEGSMGVVGKEGGERRDGMKAPCGLLSCGTVTHPGEVHTCSSTCASTAVTFSCLRACRVLVLDLPLCAREPADARPQEGRSVRPTDSGQIRDHDGLLRWSSGEYEDTLTAEQVAKITRQLPAGGSRIDDASLKLGGDVEDGRHMPRLRQLSARALEIGAFGTNLGVRATHERGHKRGRGRERTRLARRSQVSPHGRQSMENCGNPLEAALLPTRSRSHPVLPRQGKQPLQSRSAFDLPTNEKNGREEDACGKAVRSTDLGERVRPLVVGGETWVRGEADGGSDDGEEHVILIDSPHQLFGTHR